MKLKTKLLIGMLLVSLLPLIVFMGTLFLSHVKETQKLSIEKANYELNFLSSELSGYFSQRMSEIKTYSRSPIIRSMSADRFLPFIKQEISHYPDHFEKFLIARPDGHYYYSNGGNPYIGGLASFDDTNPDARAKSIIKRDYWLYTVGNNHTGTDRSYISNPMISYTTGAKQIVIASSILDQNNTVTGMFGGALPWPNIEKLISQLRDNLNARLPWESRLFLISPAGIYWYHWNPEKVVHLKTDSQGKPLINELGEKISVRTKITNEKNPQLASIGEQMIQGKQGKALLSVNNQDVLVLYKPIKNTGYSIATQIAYDEINQPVTDLIRTGVLVFLGAIFLVIGISFYLSRKISQPIVQLSKAADDIREGLWDSALPSSENYEVNHLSTAFKLMISTLKEREQSLINSKEVAEEASLAKSKFLSSMSHELRTPLNAILGYAQLLQMDNNDADTNKSLQEIAAAGNHLLELINEILDLSKIESGKMHLNIDTYHLNELLNECLSIIQPAAYKRSIDINYENCELLSVIKVDKKLFKQILLNLLSNAVKYNNENGKIIISCETQDTLLKLSITDTGNGLTNEQLKIIFNLYERGGAEYSPVEGAGLGLVISKELIELMHGEIGVESEPGKGSCFWLKIPLAHS